MTSKEESSKDDPRGPMEVGTNVYIRTVTHHYTGCIVFVSEMEILVENAAWIPDSGIWSRALESGTLDEVEPYPDGIVSVNRGAVCDVVTWTHALPRAQK